MYFTYVGSGGGQRKHEGSSVWRDITTLDIHLLFILGRSPFEISLKYALRSLKIGKKQHLFFPAVVTD